MGLTYLSRKETSHNLEGPTTFQCLTCFIQASPDREGKRSEAAPYVSKDSIVSSHFILWTFDLLLKEEVSLAPRWWSKFTQIVSRGFSHSAAKFLS